MKKMILSPTFPFKLVLRRNLSVLFFGSDSFSKSCLKSLHENLRSDGPGRIVTELATVCLPGKQSKQPVKIFAEKNNLSWSTWPSFPERDCSYDIGVVVSFGRLVPKSVIESFKFGMINVHGSLLPRWRGASPLAHAIMAGDKTTGITIMEIKAGKFDHGSILEWSEPVAIKPNWTAEDLGIALEDVASDCLLKCLNNIELYKKNLTPQDDNLVTYAPKITLKHSEISWNTDTAETVYKKFLAYGFKKDHILRTTFEGNSVKLQKLCLPNEDQLSLVDEKSTTEPGGLAFDKKSKTLLVKCKTGFISVQKLIYNKPLTAQDFYNGSMQSRLKSGKSVKFV